MHSILSVGIDPGWSGGIAFYDGMTIEAFKFDGLTERDLADLIQDRTLRTCQVYLEQVGPMPLQGVSSTWKFGQMYGMLRGMLIALHLPFETVRPQVWQREMKCLTGGDKNVSKARAQQLFPSLKMTHALADACVIAAYGYRDMIRKGAINKGEDYGGGCR
jgi:crossover junction endodeoxyribonuclease RuvC